MTVVLRDGEALPQSVRGTVVTVGTFDGVHRGHADVVRRLVARASEVGLPSLLVTFDPHPLDVVNPAAAPPLLTSREERLQMLSALGLDYVALLPFTPELASLSATDFVDRILRERLRMRELLIGHDHGFGRGRAGHADTLQALGAERGFQVDIVPPVAGQGGEAVSSTRIRKAIAAGQLEVAAHDLGRSYAIRGTVVAGEQRGRGLGFPTINVALDSERKLLPPDGVYAVAVDTPRGRFGGMMNLGGRPTFGDERRTLEAHLFDASGDFYGDVVQVGFVARLRDTQRFPDADALMRQLAEDERAARSALTMVGVPSNLNGSMQFPPSIP